MYELFIFGVGFFLGYIISSPARRQKTKDYLTELAEDTNTKATETPDKPE